MVILGANAAGVANKIDSVKRLISRFNPGVIFIQETKLRRKNKIKLDQYEVFEQIREKSEGGGILTAVHQSLEPVCISEGDDGEEIMTVEATVKGSRVRFINWYGPQENSSTDDKKSFYEFLDLEVKRAKTAGTLICIQMDSNAKLGSDYIAEDPSEQSGNGILLANIID